MQLTELSDEALVSQLAAICLDAHRLTARLVAYLIEVEERRLDLKAAGGRCPSRANLELDHIVSRALGGGDEATNLRVRCRAHNRLHAEEVFGREHIARAVDFRQRKSRCVESVEGIEGVKSVEGIKSVKSVEGIKSIERVEAPASRVDRAAGEAGTAGTSIDVAMRGLVGLGFARSDARRAIEAIARRRNARAETLPVHDVIREAIAALT
jgi:hypothetical protein